MQVEAKRKNIYVLGVFLFDLIALYE